MVDERQVGQSCRIVHFFHLAFLVVDFIRHVRHSGDYIHIKLATQAFLHDFHVQQSQEAATESKSERHRRLGLECERSIVELQFLERGSQVFKVFGIDGINTGKHHRLHFLKTFDGLIARIFHMGDGIAHLHFLRGLDARNDIAHITCRELVAWQHIHLQHSYFIGMILLFGVDKLHKVVLANSAVHYLEVGNNTAEGVEHRVENQGLQWSLGVALWRRNAFHYGIEHFLNSKSGLSACSKHLLALAAQKVHYLVFHLIGVCTVEVHFVEHGYYLEVVIDSHI